MRALILDHRWFAIALLVLALSMKALIPAGYMTSGSGTTLTVTICSDGIGALKTVDIAIPMKDGSDDGSSDHAKKDGHCAFSGLTHAATGGADTVLLALAFAFILIL
ncbi:MAG: hypothetical protein ACK5NN_06865, partial [Sphingomonadaceae bacterium]